MVDYICPKLFRMLIAFTGERKSTDNASDEFEILNAENLTQVKKLKLNADITLYIRLLCCHHVKNECGNYCSVRKNEKARQSVCEIENKPAWTHFHIYPESIPEINSEDYMLSFIENASFTKNIGNIINEQLAMINWLQMKYDVINLCLFTFGDPVYKTSNISNRE